jgi:hypothetical protein
MVRARVSWFFREVVSSCLLSVRVDLPCKLAKMAYHEGETLFRKALGEFASSRGLARVEKPSMSYGLLWTETKGIF